MRPLLGLALGLAALLACANPVPSASVPPASVPPASPGGPAPAVAVGEPDAVAVVQAVYAPYLRPDGEPPDLFTTGPLSRAFQADFAAAEARSGGEGERPPGYDVVVDAQDWQLSGLTVQAEGADVVARFSNLGRPTEVHYRMVKEGGRWVIDDVQNRGAWVREALRRE